MDGRVQPDAKVRALLSESMFVEEPELRVLVVTPEMISPIVDLDGAIRHYPWAVLAAIMNPGLDAVRTTTLAIRALLRVAAQGRFGTGGRYIQLIAASVGDDVMQPVRAQLPEADRETLSEWERRGSSFVRGRAEGLEQGLAALRSALRSVLEVRGLGVDEQFDARIVASNDIDQLRAWIVRATTATALAEVLAAED